MILIPSPYGSTIESAVIAPQALALFATDNIACVKQIGAITLATNNLLTIARPVQCLEHRAIGTSGIVGTRSIEIGATDNQPNVVAGTQLKTQFVLDSRADDVILVSDRGVVAPYKHMAWSVLAIAMSGDTSIAAWTLYSGDKNGGGMIC